MELAKRCPYCRRNLALNSLEPHPRRKGVDVLTFSCHECWSALSDFVLVCTYNLSWSPKTGQVAKRDSRP